MRRRVQITRSVDSPPRPGAYESLTGFYFCCVEALQNTAKHSCAGRAWISLDEVDKRLQFEVGDDGQGFDPARTNGGTGLQNIRDRVDALEGTLQIHSGAEGTRIEGSIPIPVQQ